MNCPNCSVTVKEEARFCDQCGCSLSGSQDGQTSEPRKRVFKAIGRGLKALGELVESWSEYSGSKGPEQPKEPEERK